MTPLEYENNFTGVTTTNIVAKVVAKNCITTDVVHEIVITI